MVAVRISMYPQPVEFVRSFNCDLQDRHSVISVCGMTARMSCAQGSAELQPSKGRHQVGVTFYGKRSIGMKPTSNQRKTLRKL